jgi:hypothetical protein
MSLTRRKKVWLNSSFLPARSATYPINCCIERIGIPKSIENLNYIYDKSNNCQLPLDDFVGEDVRGSEEGNFGSSGPPLDETLI